VRRGADDRDDEVLSGPVADRLLARASELDAKRATGATIADLRAAASEAGISSAAFDAALGEMKTAPPAPVSASSPLRRRPRFLIATIAGLFLLASTTLIVGRTVAPPNPLLIEGTIRLSCMSPAEAASLLRGHLGREGTLSFSPGGSPQSLTIRATPGEIARAQAIVSEAERTAAVCVADAPGAK
jgi:hypothetical protein